MFTLWCAYLNVCGCVNFVRVRFAVWRGGKGDDDDDDGTHEHYDVGLPLVLVCLLLNVRALCMRTPWFVFVCVCERRECVCVHGVAAIVGNWNFCSVRSETVERVRFARRSSEQEQPASQPPRSNRPLYTQ